MRGRGKLGYDKWSVTGHDGFYRADRIVGGKVETWHGSAHCLACAKVEVLVRRGGRVDLRGWHRYQGMCGNFLVATQLAIDNEKDK